MKTLPVILTALTLTVAACKKDEPKTTEPASPAPVVAAKFELKNLKLVAAGWTSSFNPNVDEWTYEKYSLGKDGINEPNRFFIDTFPQDRPTDVEAYAAKLKSDQNFQGRGWLYLSISSTEKLPRGWLIVGVEKDMETAEDPGFPSFVLYRSDLGVYCRGNAFKSETLRAEAIESCKTLKP